MQVEIESLRKELQEKQDLLCQALKAMELEEEEHKKESQEKEDALQKYQQQIEELEQKFQVYTEITMTFKKFIVSCLGEQRYFSYGRLRLRNCN